MKIQSIIRRAKGSTVELGDKVYFFSPDSDHTCDVTDEAHIERLLSIKDGFRAAGSVSVDDDDDDANDFDALVAAYVAKFGKKPHHAMKAAAISKKLAEAEKAEG